MYTAIVEWPGIDGYEEIDVFAKSYTEAWDKAEEILSRDYNDGWVILRIEKPVNFVISSIR